VTRLELHHCYCCLVPAWTTSCGTVNHSLNMEAMHSLSEVRVHEAYSRQQLQLPATLWITQHTMWLTQARKARLMVLLLHTDWLCHISPCSLAYPPPPCLPACLPAWLCVLQFGPVSHVEFCDTYPYNFAVTASTRVRPGPLSSAV
jgi:hypothetical protein